MASSVFEDKAKKPDDKALSEVLGRTAKLWDELKGHIIKDYAPASEEWKYYNSKSGWILTIRDKKRVMVYISPNKGSFVAGVTLDEKAVAAAMASSLPEEVKEVVKTAPQYPEGRVVRLEVRKKQDLENMKKIVAIRMAK